MEPTIQPLSADGGTKPGQDVGPKGPKDVEEGTAAEADSLFDEIAAGVTGGTDPQPDDGTKGHRGIAEEGSPVSFTGGSDPQPNDPTKGDKRL